VLELRFITPLFCIVGFDPVEVVAAKTANGATEAISPSKGI
jgi:hypothetical protein